MSYQDETPTRMYTRGDASKCPGDPHCGHYPIHLSKSFGPLAAEAAEAAMMHLLIAQAKSKLEIALGMYRGHTRDSLIREALTLLDTIATE